MEDNRLIAILQVFTIILVFKGISATYIATAYGVRERLDIINQYASFLTFVPIPLFCSLILFSLPIFFKNIKQKTKRIIDLIALSVIIIALISLFIFPKFFM